MRIRTFTNTNNEFSQMGKSWHSRSLTFQPTTQSNSPFWSESEQEMTWDFLQKAMYLLYLDALVGGEWVPIIHKGHLVVENARKFAK